MYHTHLKYTSTKVPLFSILLVDNIIATLI